MRCLRDAFISGKPPSANQLYANTSNGRFLKNEGKRYINEANDALCRWWLTAAPMDPQAPYELRLTFYLECVVNRSYGKPSKLGKPGAQNRFRKIDLSGLVKLLEDVIVKVTGVDDANTLRLVLEKRENRFDPHVEIEIWGGEELESFVTS